MAGGAASRRGQQIAQAAREAANMRIVEVDPNKVPAVCTERFLTGYVDVASVDEARDDEDKITTAAHVALTLKEPPFIAQLGDQIVTRGGTWRSTDFSPELAIAVGEELAKLGREALETRKEQPLKTDHLIATAADMAAAVATADVAQDLKGTGT